MIYEDLIKYLGIEREFSVVMIKSFEDKEGCSLCQLKWENFEQWKRIKTIFGNKVKIIGLFSREWSDIIKSYNFVEFLPLSNEFEKRLRGVSSYTIIFKDGKVIFEYKGEIDLREYRKISEIINKELKSKNK